MSGVLSCKQCGCSEIDTDPARGDAVCTSCGFVLEESIIVSEVTFEEDGHGGASAVGQFVSSESRGGGGLSGAVSGFHTGVGKESRELTLRNAKKRIVEVAQQLRLNQHCIDVAFNFFKMALHKQLTKGRKNSLTVAACIYMTCRIEGTPHLLIDFSDVLQMDVYALGRAYVQISRALYINIPAVDPCMYILRFAHKFELGDKTHDVAMTALRLVQRMKRDWIHLGRRPSGLCGAALLISARLHNFSRSVQDVIRVVKVHETTLRKRLVEFGETPSSSLTLDEFMSVDLEEEHDPPSFKAARIKDRERLQKLLDDEDGEEFKVIQGKIDEELDKRRRKYLSRVQNESPLPRAETPEITGCMVKDKDDADAKRFIRESTLNTITTLIPSDQDTKRPIIKPDKSDVSSSSSVTNNEERTSKEGGDIDRMLMPPPSSASSVTANGLEVDLIASESDSENEDVEASSVVGEFTSDNGELDLCGIDDDEINGYIMNTQEIKKKTAIWEKLNADYILLQKQKQEQLERDIKEGKLDKKKKRKNPKAKPTFQAKSANEAIKIMLQERKISSKINYDVLRSLTAVDPCDEETSSSAAAIEEPITVIESGPVVRGGSKRKIEEKIEHPGPSNAKKSKSSRSSRKKSIDEKSKDDADSISVSDTVDKESSVPISIENVEEDTHIETDTEKHDDEEEEDDDDVIADTQQDVVIESGPVVQPNLEDQEAVIESGEVFYTEEDDEDEEEDDESLSASRLLTQFRGAGEEENDYDDYYD